MEKEGIKEEEKIIEEVGEEEEPPEGGGETVEGWETPEKEELIGLSFTVRSRKFRRQPPFSKVKVKEIRWWKELRKTKNSSISTEEPPQIQKMSST